MGSTMMSSKINLARSVSDVTQSNIQEGEILSMKDAVSRTCSLYWRKFGIRPTTLAIPIGWWEVLHDFFTEELGLAYNQKCIPMTFGKPFSTGFNVGIMESEIDPFNPGNTMSKHNDDLPNIDFEKELEELNDDDDEMFDIAFALSELMDDADEQEDDVDYIIEFSAYHEVEQEWVEYEFATNKNGSLILDEDIDIMYAFVYGKINKKGRMKSPRLAIVWNDQPNSVYTWPIYVDTLYNTIINGSLSNYIATHLAIGEDMEHEFFQFEEFKRMMLSNFGINI